MLWVTDKKKSVTILDQLSSVLKLGFGLPGSMILDKLSPLYLYCLICEMGGLSLSLAEVVYESSQLLQEPHTVHVNN